MPAIWDQKRRIYFTDPAAVDEKIRTGLRRHPLAGEPGPKVFRDGPAACGNPVYSSSMEIGRSTKLALAPAERRLNEDWAIFFDHND